MLLYLDLGESKDNSFGGEEDGFKGFATDWVPAVKNWSEDMVGLKKVNEQEIKLKFPINLLGLNDIDGFMKAFNSLVDGS